MSRKSGPGFDGLLLTRGSAVDEPAAMGDRSAGSGAQGYVMRWTAFALLAVTAGLAIGVVEAATRTAAAEPTIRRNASAITDVSAQQYVRRPPRVVIYPRYPYRYMYRQCADGYVV